MVIFFVVLNEKGWPTLVAYEISHTSKASQAGVLQPFDVRRWQEAAPCILPSPLLLTLFFILR